MAPLTSPSRARRRLEPLERRRLVVAAALDVFATRGYAEASIDQIARRAGITKPVVYDHFASKRALYLHLMRTEMERLSGVVRQASAGGETPGERLHAAIDAFFALVEQRPLARALLFRDPALDTALAAAHARGQRRATAEIAALLASDTNLLRDDPDREQGIELLAEGLKTGLNGLAAWWWNRPAIPRAVMTRRAMQLFARGLEQLRDG